MAGISRLMTSAAAVGGLVCVFASSEALAERATPRASDNASASAGRATGWTAGSIQGVVQDENGAPIKGAVVTALGGQPSTKAIAFTTVCAVNTSEPV